MRAMLNCIMLIDDNPHDNFFHQRVLNKSGIAKKVIIKDGAEAALGYLRQQQPGTRDCPDLIFLDINMPRMNGWEFLEEYAKLDKALTKNIVVVMLTTSESAEDKSRAMSLPILNGFLTKPLTEENIKHLMENSFGQGSGR